MKVEKREIEQPKPPCEIVVTMSREEAEYLLKSLRWYSEEDREFRGAMNLGKTFARTLRDMGNAIKDVL